MSVCAGGVGLTVAELGDTSFAFPLCFCFWVFWVLALIGDDGDAMGGSVMVARFLSLSVSVEYPVNGPGHEHDTQEVLAACTLCTVAPKKQNGVHHRAIPQHLPLPRTSCPPLYLLVKKFVAFSDDQSVAASTNKTTATSGSRVPSALLLGRDGFNRPRARIRCAAHPRTPRLSSARTYTHHISACVPRFSLSLLSRVLRGVFFFDVYYFIVN